MALIEASLEEKLDNCARVYRTLDAEAQIYKQEAARLSGKANILENRALRLKEYIAYCLGEGNKAKTELFDFSWRKSEQVAIYEPSIIPKQYQRTKTTIEPDKILIKQDIKAGANILGAELVTNFSLQIK